MYRRGGLIDPVYHGGGRVVYHGHESLSADTAAATGVQLDGMHL